MNLLKQNQELNTLLDQGPIHVFNTGLFECYMIRPMPESDIDYNCLIYFHNNNPYIITQLDSFRYSGQFISAK